MATEYVDLLAENGEIIRIEYPGKHFDDLHETIENAMKRGDWWSPGQWDGCSATYMGISIGRVNMKKVIGML